MESQRLICCLADGGCFLGDLGHSQLQVFAETTEAHLNVTGIKTEGNVPVVDSMAEWSSLSLSLHLFSNVVSARMSDSLSVTGYVFHLCLFFKLRLPIFLQIS